MKKIITLLLLISLFSCKNNNNNKIVLDLNIKNKKLFRFLGGNPYYSLRGISYKDSIYSYDFKFRGKFLNLEMKNKFINGFNEGWIIDDSLNFYLHDLSIIKSIPITIKFNNYKKKETYFIPNFTRENFEILKNRSSYIYELNSNLDLINIYSNSGIIPTRQNINNIIFYNTTLNNLLELNKINMYPKDYDSFIVVHNPLTNLYSLVPDFNKFGVEKTDLIDKIKDNITYENLIEKKVKDTIIFDKNLVIDKNLIFDNKTVIFSSGIVVNIVNKSNLIFNNSVVNFKGNESNQIMINGSKENSIYFRNCNKIEINHSTFKNLRNFVNDTINLPSALTFYNSNVKIENSEFINNVIGDDFINFYNSSFTMNNSLVENSFADAIDSDFSTGVINNLKLNQIGNDGLDFSGSVVNINNSFLNNVGDKAISAGESSNVTISNSNIENSEMAIVVKDGSKLKAIKNKLFKNKIDYAVFFKKDFYASPVLNLEMINENNLNLFQENTIINIESKQKINYLKDVESLLYGNLYGKASK